MALLGPELRAARTGPLLWGAALATGLCALPLLLGRTPGPGAAAALLHLAAVLCGLGLAFVLDDPAAPTTAVCPVPWWRRRGVRLAAALLALVPVRALDTALIHAALPAGRSLPNESLPNESSLYESWLYESSLYGELGLQALALALLTTAFALLGLAVTGGRTGGAVAAPGLIAAVLALLTLPPEPAAFFADPADGAAWAAAVGRWHPLLAVAAAATLVLLPRPPGRRRGRPVRKGRRGGPRSRW
ncbi:hypothetical protein ABT354_33765 [Streptomyces sp. NPDC000594]|uniref:hypothetical protein n=1 Tax=Streptomyces sp. NPDC000594 TaxID=3154261 RepID=UPI00332A8C22